MSEVLRVIRSPAERLGNEDNLPHGLASEHSVSVLDFSMKYLLLYVIGVSVESGSEPASEMESALSRCDWGMKSVKNDGKKSWV